MKRTISFSEIFRQNKSRLFRRTVYMKPLLEYGGSIE